MNTRTLRLTLLGLALGVLLALVLAPQTRWLVRLQVLTLLHQYRPIGCASYSASLAGDARAYTAAATRHPDDFASQYAQTVLRGDAEPLANLRALTRRFPNSPILYANLLRQECRRLNPVRPDSSLLQNQPVPSYVSHLSVPTPETLAAYDKEAAAGERVDPANAYFPFMRAFGLFAAHRDSEALAAVKRASAKPQWNEYITEHMEAKWRLHTEAFGDPGALPQAALWSGELLPQYQRLRETARIAVYQAVLKEQAGHREEGYQIREAVRRCGDAMCARPTLFIAALVGVAIITTAEVRPGGGPALGQSGGDEPDSVARQRIDSFCAYARKIGHPEAVQRARDQEDARRRLLKIAGSDPEMSKYVAPFWNLSFWWMGGGALLLNAAWLAAFGMLAAGWSRLKLTPKPPIGWNAVLLHCLLAVGAWLFLALLFVCLSGVWITVVYHAAIDWLTTVGVGAGFGLTAGLIGYGLRRLTRLHRVSVLKTALLLPALLGAAYGFYALVQWVAWPLAEIPQGMMTVMGQDNSDTQPSALWLCVAATLVVPLLLTLILLGAALVRRVSVPGALTAGFQHLAVPLTCILVIAYGGVLLGTARQEQKVAVFNQQIVTSSGQYFAARAGVAWPGPVK